MQHSGRPIATFFAAALVLLPVTWYWRTRNVSTLAIIGWLCLLNVIYGVDSIIWDGNVLNPAPVYCDIITILMIGVRYALPAAVLCITVHHKFASSSHEVRVGQVRQMIFESVMCFGVPIIFMALHLIVQDHRFDIVEGFGCRPATYVSMPSILIAWLPLLILSVTSLVYAAVALRYYFMHHISFASHLSGGDSLTTHRYFRLIGMSVVLIVGVLSLLAFEIYNEFTVGLKTWTTLADIHSKLSSVEVYTNLTIPSDLNTRIEVQWWSIPISAYIVFLFLGTGKEAMKNYGNGFFWFRHIIFRQKTAPLSSGGPLPTFHVIRKAVVPRTDTGDSDLNFEHSLHTPEKAVEDITKSADNGDKGIFVAPTLFYLQSPVGRKGRALVGQLSDSPEFMRTSIARSQPLPEAGYLRSLPPLHEDGFVDVPLNDEPSTHPNI